MQFSITSALALLAASLVVAAQAPSVTITTFPDLECKTGPGVPVTLMNGSCGIPDRTFQSFLVPTTINPAFDDMVGMGCGFILADVGCTVLVENVIEVDLSAGKCLPAVIYGNFAGPQPAEEITLRCSPFI